MVEKKPKGKFGEGHEPWTALGLKYSTYKARLDKERERGELDGPTHRALQRALDIASGTIVPDPVEVHAPAAAEPTSAVEEPAAPAEPESTEVPVVAVAAERISPEPMVTPKAPAMVYRPAASLSAPAEPLLPAVAGATVFVSFRCPASVHDRMREMAHHNRVKLQGIVGAAVEAYLSQNGF